MLKALIDLVRVQALVLWERLVGQVPLPEQVPLCRRQHKAVCQQ